MGKGDPRGRRKGSGHVWPPERIEKAKVMAMNGMSYTEIGEAFGAKGQTVRNALSRQGKYVTQKDIAKKRWQPIETAPKDLWILCYGEDRMLVAKWAYADQYWYDKRDENGNPTLYTFKPTHWVHVPEPPK